MAYRRRFSGFRRSRAPKAAVMQRQIVQKSTRYSTCAGCGGTIAVGETALRLKLRKAFMKPCATCGTSPKSAKRYHLNCAPADPNKAMGFDPSQHAAAAPTAPAYHTVTPPPRPPSAGDAALAALAALEQALVLKLKDDPKAWTIKDGKRVLVPELEKQFQTYQGLKARALRPGTPAEGETATSIAIQRIVKMVYA